MTTSKTHRRFHRFFTILATILTIGSLTMGAWFLIFHNTNEETNDAQVDQYVTPVVTRITGYVKEVRYNENQFVRKGDTLIVIDGQEYKANLDMAVAEQQNASHNLNFVQKSISTVQSDIDVKKSQLKAAKSELWKAEQEYKRFKALFLEDAATQQQVETVKTTYESAKAHYNEILNMIRSTEFNTAEVASKIPVAQSSIAQKQAVVDKASLFLSYTVITAPYDGWIGRRTIQPGQLVKEGQTLCSIVSKEKWITANYKETQIAQIQLGQEVTINADTDSSREFNGVVESFSPASGSRFTLLPPDNATGNFVKIEQRIPVRIKLTDPEEETGSLRAGMSVTVIARHSK